VLVGKACAGGVGVYAVFSWERMEADGGVFWPCRSEDEPGQARVFTERFPTPDGRARFVAVEHRPVAEEIDDAHPIYLTTGRNLQHYQSGAQTRMVPALAAALAEPYVEIHPDLAARNGLADGDEVRVVSRRGDAVGTVRLSTAIRPDTVFMPFHWGGARAVNRVTNPALDPVSKMPEFKVCAVRLERRDDERAESVARGTSAGGGASEDSSATQDIEAVAGEKTGQVATEPPMTARQT
jgi:assimilatory nitrate reductase catalytic subunit